MKKTNQQQLAIFNSYLEKVQQHVFEVEKHAWKDKKSYLRFVSILGRVFIVNFNLTGSVLEANAGILPYISGQTRINDNIAFKEITFEKYKSENENYCSPANRLSKSVFLTQQNMTYRSVKNFKVMREHLENVVIPLVEAKILISSNS